MYERMLNKQEQPQYNETCMHRKEHGELFAGLNTWLMETSTTHQDITLPYDNHYGRGVTHRECNKLMCNMFPGTGAFTAMLQLPDIQFAPVYERLQLYTKECADNRYPCGNSDQVHYRVCEETHMEGIQRLLFLRCD